MQLNGSIGQQRILYKGYLDCVRTMAQTEGLRGFYRGFTVSCIRTAPSAAVQASFVLLHGSPPQRSALGGVKASYIACTRLLSGARPACTCIFLSLSLWCFKAAAA